MTRLFGTDGVRGVANELLTADLALRLSQSAAVVLGGEGRGDGRRPVGVVARDPRVSGVPLGCGAGGSGLHGVDVFDAGVLPTPAAAFLVGDIDADFGVMISASHNPAADNGIKFLGAGGHKLDDALEDAIEAQMGVDAPAPVGADVGRVQRFADAEDRYVVHLLASLGGISLEGVKVVLDCAHGAASGCSPEAFAAAGAEVIVIGADPDGLNINAGYGSTHLQNLQQAVLAHGADLGWPMMGTRTGAWRWITAAMSSMVIRSWGSGSGAERGWGLVDDTLVVTVMSNLGLKLGLAEAGISVVETAVGDRYVLEGMRAGGYSLGGEQSGHLIFADYATTGDGVLTGLQLAARVAATGKSLKELAGRR